MNIPVDYDQDDWGALVPMDDGTYGTMVPDKVVIHWGGGTKVEEASVPWEMDRLRRWDNYHTNGKGWAGGLAYNYAVGNSGSKYRARGWNESGAQSGDEDGDDIRENQEGLAIVWIGGSASVPTNVAFETMTEFIRDIMAADSNITRVIGHREIKSSTACPGDIWMQFIEEERWKEMIARDDKADDGLPVHDSNFQEAVDAGVMSGFTQPGGVAFNDEIATFLARAGVYNIAKLEARIVALEAGGGGLQDGDNVTLNKSG